MQDVEVNNAPPMRFMAMAMVSCVSREMAPSDMPPVQKRVMMSAADSTSSMEIGSSPDTSSRQSRSTAGGLSLKCCSYALYASCDHREAGGSNSERQVVQTPSHKRSRGSEADCI